MKKNLPPNSFTIPSKLRIWTLTFYVHVTGTDASRLPTTFLMPFIEWKPSQTLHFWHVFIIWCFGINSDSVITINKVHYAFFVLKFGLGPLHWAMPMLRNIWDDSPLPIKLDKYAGLTNFLSLLLHIKTLLVINLDLKYWDILFAVKRMETAKFYRVVFTGP